METCLYDEGGDLSSTLFSSFSGTLHLSFMWNPILFLCSKQCYLFGTV